MFSDGQRAPMVNVAMTGGGGTAFKVWRRCVDVDRVMIFAPFVARRPIVLTCAAMLIGAVAVIDWRVAVNVSFGFLYVFPVMLAASVLSRGAIALTAVLCTVLSDLFDPFPTALSVGLLSDVSAFAALTGAGLFVHEVIRSRRGEMEHVRRIEEEVVARRQAEEQLAFLIDSSPVAILTMTGEGSLLTLLLFPVGLRYHTLHHAFPLMPYHSMGEAHRRLMEQSAGDSVYRSTIVPSYWAAIRELLRGARMAGQAGQNPMQVWRSSETTMSAQ